MSKLFQIDSNTGLVTSCAYDKKIRPYNGIPHTFRRMPDAIFKSMKCDGRFIVGKCGARRKMAQTTGKFDMGQNWFIEERNKLMPLLAEGNIDTDGKIIKNVKKVKNLLNG